MVRHFTDACEPGPRGGRAPDLVGFSLSWELDIVNLLSMLDAMGVPRRAEDRLKQQDSQHPAYSDSYRQTIVFGGGAVLSANPEPYADFFDVVLMGDGEELLGSFLDAFSAAKGAGTSASRQDILQALATVSFARACLAAFRSNRLKAGVVAEALNSQCGSQVSSAATGRSPSSASPCYLHMSRRSLMLGLAAMTPDRRCLTHDAG